METRDTSTVARSHSRFDALFCSTAHTLRCMLHCHIPQLNRTSGVEQAYAACHGYLLAHCTAKHA